MSFISNLFEGIINFLGSLYPTFRNINNFIGTLLPALVVYQTVYFIIGLFWTRKFKPAKKKHKYGIVIAARNEEMVIGNLIDSIHKQDYPKDLLTIFVVADNCTDKTAQIAREKGCICYERFDDTRKTKGFALEYLFDRIEEDYGRLSFEGYFVFDADNLLKSDYISRMNDAFDSGEKMITSYRNIKNIDENWITLSFAVHWLRSIRHNHRARSVLRLATNIQGTGYLFASEVVANGWHYTSLTEDRGLTADAVAQGYRISYQDAAEFYDEQTPNWKVAYNQKLRWSKGLLINFKESGWKLFVNIIFGRKYAKVKWSKDNNFPFLREDQTFISELYNDNLFAEYTAHKPMETIKTAQEVDAIERDAKNSEVVADKMDAEDRQVYNQIIESLNYLILQNPTNEYLPTIVNNITKRVVDAILRKEYRFLPLGDVVAGVMFEGIDVTPEMESVRELVLSAFPEEREMNEGRGLA